MPDEIDVEIQALGIAIDAFNMVDKDTAKRMLWYLTDRFVETRPDDPKPADQE